MGRAHGTIRVRCRTMAECNSVRSGTHSRTCFYSRWTAGPSHQSSLRSEKAGTGSIASSTVAVRVPLPGPRVVACLRGLLIDYKFELGRLFDWQIGRLGTLNDLVHVSCRAAI